MTYTYEFIKAIIEQEMRKIDSRDKMAQYQGMQIVLNRFEDIEHILQAHETTSKEKPC